MSDKGGFYGTLIFPFQVEKQHHISFIPLLAASCLKHILQSLNIESFIKPPNDLLTSKGKIAGFLTNSIPFDTKHFMIALGCGINLNNTSCTLKQSVQDQPICTVLDYLQGAFVDQNLFRMRFEKQLNSTLKTFISRKQVDLSYLL